MGYAFSAGKRDNTVDRDEILEHLRTLAAATDLPVSADLENGFGDALEVAADVPRLRPRVAAACRVGPSHAAASGGGYRGSGVPRGSWTGKGVLRMRRQEGNTPPGVHGQVAMSSFEDRKADPG
jgi:hypothetical protein